MKRSLKNKWPLPVLVFLFTCFNSYAQNSQHLPGLWEGKLNINVELRIVFHIEKSGDGFAATVDSPDQSVFGIDCDTVIAFPDSIRINISRLYAMFSGKLINDSTMDGTLRQGGTIPLILHKKEFLVEPTRPQTPKAPFPYKSEDVEYDNADHSLHYGATISIPPGKGPFPAAVLITGSGQQDRDETLSGHKTFAVLADALTRNGFVVLRVDDRGVGKSTGSLTDGTTADFAKDVNTSFDYLLSRPEVDKKKAGLIGHSEGGVIAPMVASQRKDIYFMVLLAAPGIKIDQLMTEQNEEIQHSVGIKKETTKAYTTFYKKLVAQVIAAPDTVNTYIAAYKLFKEWEAVTDPAQLKELGFDTEETKQETIAGLVRIFSTKWLKYFVAFDPQAYLQKVNSKVLALNGSKDIQVNASSNLGGIGASLKKSKSKQYTIKELPGLNHLFQTCITCTLSEYTYLDETFSPAALKEINDWLNKYVK